MNIVKLKIIKPNCFWNVGDLCLGPDKKESLSFDLDLVDPRMKRTIIRGEEVFKIIEIIPCDGLPEFSLELPENAVPLEETGLTSITDSEEIVGPAEEEEPEIETIEITEEDRQNARIVLGNKISVIGSIVKALPQNSVSRQRLLVLIQEEQKLKNRKTLLALLEKAFLSIFSEGD